MSRPSWQQVITQEESNSPARRLSLSESCWSIRHTVKHQPRHELFKNWHRIVEPGMHKIVKSKQHLQDFNLKPFSCNESYSSSFRDKTWLQTSGHLPTSPSIFFFFLHLRLKSASNWGSFGRLAVALLVLRHSEYVLGRVKWNGEWKSLLILMRKDDRKKTLLFIIVRDLLLHDKSVKIFIQ